MRFALLWTSIVLYFCIACAQTPSAPANNSADLSGERAMQHVRTLVGFGPRPVASEALVKARQYIVAQLKSYGYGVEEDAFDATTPYGSKKMVNLIARRGKSDQPAIVLTTHYDTKYYEKIAFVGANDGGSGTGLLLELARVLSKRSGALDLWLVFLDGEEALVEWSSFDGTYGSRHLARRWKSDGTTNRIRALVLLDMIGDKNLDLFYEKNSTPWLMKMCYETARDLNLPIFSSTETPIEDDHIPFLDVGVPSVDLIDLNYVANGQVFWHTAEDTIDKISVQSLERVGKLVLAIIPKIEKR